MESPHATALASRSHVTIIPFSGYNNTDTRRVLVGVDSTFANTNGFAIGEKVEIYWRIRIYELAREAGVRHFVWASTDYSSKPGGSKPEFRCGHADMKGGGFGDYSDTAYISCGLVDPLFGPLYGNAVGDA